MESSSLKGSIFSNNSKTAGIFGKTSSAAFQNISRAPISSSTPVPSIFKSEEKVLSSIPAGSIGFNSRSSESRSVHSQNSHEFRTNFGSKVANFPNELSQELEEKIIRRLSEGRKNAYEAFIEIDRRAKNEVRKKCVDVDMEEQGVKAVEFRQNIDINKEFSEQNLINLQEFRDLINQMIEEAEGNEKNVLAEMALVSMIYFMHFVDEAYTLIYARIVLGQLVAAKRKEERYTERYDDMNWEEKIFEHLKAAEFEQAALLFDVNCDNYDKDRELYDHLYKTILPVKNYFKEGFSGSSQTYEIINTFETMRQNAASLLIAIQNKDVDKSIINSLKLLSGEITVISPEPLEYIYLSLIFKNGFLNDKDKEQLKVNMLDLCKKSVTDADRKSLIDSCISFALENPYDTFNKIKKSYPLWFSESLVFMWDASGLLHAETFKMSKEKGEEINTRIIEYFTAEYVDYLISKEYRNSLQIVEPYLNILDDESLASSLRSLVKFDFDRSSIQSFKQYEEVYNYFKSKRNNPELEYDYERLVELRARYFEEKENKEQVKRSFYEALKLYIKKKSLKSFNDLVIKKIDQAFEANFEPDQLFEDSFTEYKDWKEISNPFKLLATYCEILTAINNRNNKVLNEKLKDIFLTKLIECPQKYKILIIQSISKCILNELVSVDQDIIMKMITEFQRFECRRNTITSTNFKDSLSSSERQSIRYALNQAFCCCMIKP